MASAINDIRHLHIVVEWMLALGPPKEATQKTQGEDSILAEETP